MGSGETNCLVTIENCISNQVCIKIEMHLELTQYDAVFATRY